MEVGGGMDDIYGGFREGMAMQLQWGVVELCPQAVDKFAVEFNYWHRKSWEYLKTKTFHRKCLELLVGLQILSLHSSG